MKRGLVIHVHGVASPEEAERLEALGVDLIGVTVGARPAGRTVSSDAARAVSTRLQRAQLCVEAADGEAVPEARAAQRMGARVVQVPWRQEISRAWRESLAQAGLQWSLVRVPADEDDDPTWVQSRLKEAGPPPPAWAHVEICPSLENGWHVLREPSENELDARDLDALAAETPILFSLPLVPGEIDEVRRGLRHALGLSFTLADDLGTVAGVHRFTLEQVQVLLERLAI